MTCEADAKGAWEWPDGLLELLAAELKDWTRR